MSSNGMAECAKCGAKPGQPCTSYKGKRCAMHAGRGVQPVKRRVRRSAERWEPADLYDDQGGPATSPAAEGGTDGE